MRKKKCFENPGIATNASRLNHHHHPFFCKLSLFLFLSTTFPLSSSFVCFFYFPFPFSCFLHYTLLTHSHHFFLVDQPFSATLSTFPERFRKPLCGVNAGNVHLWIVYSSYSLLFPVFYAFYVPWFGFFSSLQFTQALIFICFFIL